MKRLPDRPHPDHLKEQAKDLLAAYRRGDPDAVARFRNNLPAAAARDNGTISNPVLRLRDAQSCLAREYGFASWTDMNAFVTARRASSSGRDQAIFNWLRLVYAGDISGGANRASPAAAARMLEESPDLASSDACLACATGDGAAIRRATERDRAWVNRPGGPLNLPPLVAVTHSSLVRLPAFGERLRTAARFLLDVGADPDQAVGSRWPPDSLRAPSETCRLSALYGAAGQNHDPELTGILLNAGANPNDGESLYHALENPACARLLLAAGARITGTNALYRVLDLDCVETLRLLLEAGADPNEPAGGPPTTDWGAPLLWAIRRRRSPAHIEALLSAGADPLIRTPDGTSAYVLALRFGLEEAAERLCNVRGGESLADDERFVAACALADEAAARRMQARRPDLPGALSQKQLRLLPELAALGRGEAVRLMVRLGWPIAIPGGDWEASALNHAVFRGDTDLARFLLGQGASWRERHGFGDNVCGTLSWASLNEPEGVGDWSGCAEILVAHGMPAARPDPDSEGGVLIDGQRKRFSDEVTELLLKAP